MGGGCKNGWCSYQDRWWSSKWVVEVKTWVVVSKEGRWWEFLLFLQLGSFGPSNLRVLTVYILFVALRTFNPLFLLLLQLGTFSPSHLRVLTLYKLYFLYLLGSGPSAPPIWECWQFINLFLLFLELPTFGPLHLRLLTVYKLYLFYLLCSGPSAPPIWECWQFTNYISFILSSQPFSPHMWEYQLFLNYISTFSPKYLRVLTVDILYFI